MKGIDTVVLDEIRGSLDEIHRGMKVQREINAMVWERLSLIEARSGRDEDVPAIERPDVLDDEAFARLEQLAPQVDNPYGKTITRHENLITFISGDARTLKLLEAAVACWIHEGLYVGYLETTGGLVDGGISESEVENLLADIRSNLAHQKEHADRLAELDERIGLIEDRNGMPTEVSE